METHSYSAETQSNEPIPKMRVVLVDDDPIFGRQLQKIADKERVELTYISSPEEAYRTLPTSDFDVALFDYDLGRVTGIQLCHYLQREGRKFPVMLVSHWGEVEAWRWPVSVKRSVSKRAGAYSILSIARKICQDNGRRDG